MKSNLQDVEVIFQTQTEKAVCVRSDESSKQDNWLPKSQCEVEAKEGWLIRGVVVVLTAEEQTLIDKGLI